MKKLNFINIKEDDILDREELRNVMAGCGGSGSDCILYCGSYELSCPAPCSVSYDVLNCHPGRFGCAD
jgi:hypothetical protein